MSKNELSVLLDKIIEGNQSAFREFYDKTNTFVFQVALSHLCDYNDASDVLQNVYIKIYSLKKELLPKYNTMQWLRSVVRNESNLFLRHKHNAESIDEYADTLPTVNFEEQLLDNMSFEYYLRFLPQDEREIVLLRIVGCFSHKEIAKILGEPEGTIRWKYREALKKVEWRMMEREQFKSKKNKKRS